MACSVGTGVLWVPRGEVTNSVDARHAETGWALSDLCGHWVRRHHVSAVFGEVARPCWECEGTRPKGSKGEKSLELHGGKWLLNIKCAERYRNTGRRERMWLEMQWLEVLKM